MPIFGPKSLAQRPAIVAAAILLFGTGLWLTVRGGGSNDIIQRWEVQRKGGIEVGSGVTVGYVTSSGSAAFSGVQLAIGDGFVGTGKLIINSTLGGLICLPNSSGVMKAVFIGGTTVTVRTPQGTECTQ